MTPEKSFWLEFLFQALDDVTGARVAFNSPRQRLICQNETRAWFLADDSTPGSFLFACEALSIDPGAVRRALKNATIVEIRKRLRHRSDFIERPYTDGLDNPRFESTCGRRVSAL